MGKHRKRLDLAVIESRWWDTSNDSVRGLFDLLAGMRKDNPFAYHYEMFNNAASLRYIINRIAKQDDIRNVYVAAHGAKDAIETPDDTISRTIFRNILGEIGSKHLYGVFFGSCAFGLQTEAIMEKTKLTWIAGYTKEVGWVESSAMDLYFWNAFYSSSVPKKKKKSKRAAAMIHLLMALLQRVPSLFDELGFRATVAWKNGSFMTFPDDFEEYIEDTSPAIRRIMEKYPGSWP